MNKSAIIIGIKAFKLSSDEKKLLQSKNPLGVILFRRNIKDPKQVLKVDDTCLGIQEGKQAGCCTAGVARWSTNMDISSYDEKNNLDEDIINDKLKKTRQVLNKQEPTYLINTLTELKHCIDPLNLKN